MISILLRSRPRFHFDPYALTNLTKPPIYHADDSVGDNNNNNDDNNDDDDDDDDELFWLISIYFP